MMVLAEGSDWIGLERIVVKVLVNWWDDPSHLDWAWRRCWRRRSGSRARSVRRRNKETETFIPFSDEEGHGSCQGDIDGF